MKTAAFKVIMVLVGISIATYIFPVPAPLVILASLCVSACLAGMFVGWVSRRVSPRGERYAGVETGQPSMKKI